MSRRRWFALAVVLVLALAGRIWIGAPLQVHTSSMGPGVLPGDVVWVRYRAARRGEVVRAQMAPGELPQLARLVATEGQSVEVSEGVLYVDAMPLAVGPTRRSSICGGARVLQVLERSLGRDVWVVPGADMAVAIVPAGHVWLLGDRRAEAGDSQRWGAVSAALLQGVATRLVWPSAQCQGSRWSRLANRIN
jgi:signal peptidase I